MFVSLQVFYTDQDAMCMVHLSDTNLTLRGSDFDAVC